MNTRTRNVLIALSVVALVLIGGYYTFAPAGEDSKDLNTLGTITFYEYRNADWREITENYVLDASTVYYPKLRVLFTGSFKTTTVTCKLIGSDGLAQVAHASTVIATGMQWDFTSTEIQNVPADKYYLSFSGMYDEASMIGLHGVTHAFYIIGTTGVPAKPTISAPGDVVITVSETKQISWTYNHLLPTHYTIYVGSVSVASGSGNVGGPGTTVTYTVIAEDTGEYQVTLEVFVDASTVSQSDTVKVTVVGTSSTTTTTTTTPTGTTTPPTTTTSPTGTTTSTGTTTEDDDGEPEGGLELGYLIIAGVVVVIVVYVYKKRS